MQYGKPVTSMAGKPDKCYVSRQSLMQYGKPVTSMAGKPNGFPEEKEDSGSRIILADTEIGKISRRNMK
ncbi:hypothetical protein FACS1894127_6500 [Clostridia bacterium]|nr:hypothetical protein FACS1894127_6500 [Clostridia bacterium]